MVFLLIKLSLIFSAKLAFEIRSFIIEFLRSLSVYIHKFEKKKLIKCSRFGNKLVYLLNMRVIAIKTLKDYIDEFHQAEQALLSWYEEAASALWNNPNELKAQYKNASILNEKRVVFNIHGNSYRLIVDIEYRLKIVFIVWFGSHSQYDKINAKTISYVKTN